MLKNYFKIAYRTLLKHKLFSALNLAGLTLSLVSCLLIYRFIAHHLSFDDFHANADQIYRVVAINEYPTETEYEAETPYPLGDALKADFPEFLNVVSMHAEPEAVIKAGKDKFKETDIIFANSDFLDVFNFRVLKGSSSEVLDEPNNVFLSDNLAQKYFGNDDPLGEIITFGNGMNLKVAGIIQNPPENTHIPMRMLISYPSLKEHYKGFGFDLEHWGVVLSGFTYVRIPENYDPQRVESKLTSLVDKHFSIQKGEKKRFELQKLSDIHLSTTWSGDDLKSVVNPAYLKIISLIGVFILVIACINFINLATAQALKRAKEVGIRKVIGAGRKQLIIQFMGEVTLIVFMAVIISWGLADFFGKYLESFLEVQGGFQGGSKDVLFLLATLALVSVLSGLYPAFMISSYQPIESLKNNLKAGNSGALYLRRVLVILQFTVSLTLIIGTIVVSQQVDFFKGKELGFRKDAVLLVEIPEPKKTDLEAFKGQLADHPFIKNISFNLGAPTSTNNLTTSISTDLIDKSAGYQTSLKFVDNDYLETFGLKLRAGRWFTKSEETYLSNPDIPASEKDFKFVVNETLVKTLGYSSTEDILGTFIQTGFGGIRGEVVGVADDFNIKSLHHAVEPVVLHHMPDFYYQAAFTVQEGKIREGISEIEKVWTKAFPEAVFEYNFLDKEIEKLYKAEEKISFLLMIFSGVAIGIGCMGLFGLSAFMTLQRTKEIGVRKILGASITSILKLLSNEILILIVVANVISIPIAWYCLSRWLENFPYRIDIKPGVFVLAFSIAVVLALVTVSYQTIKAALANPVDSLKND